MIHQLLRRWWGRPSSAAPQPDEQPPASDSGGWTPLGAVQDLQRAGRLCATAGPEAVPVVVVRTRRGPVAFRNQCPHLGRTLADAVVQGDRVRCPGHGREYSLRSGATVGGWARSGGQRLHLLRVTLVGDQICVQLPEGAHGVTGSADPGRDFAGRPHR